MIITNVRLIRLPGTSGFRYHAIHALILTSLLRRIKLAISYAGWRFARHGPKDGNRRDVVAGCELPVVAKRRKRGASVESRGSRTSGPRPVAVPLCGTRGLPQRGAKSTRGGSSRRPVFRCRGAARCKLRVASCRRAALDARPSPLDARCCRLSGVSGFPAFRLSGFQDFPISLAPRPSTLVSICRAPSLAPVLSISAFPHFPLPPPERVFSTRLAGRFSNQRRVTSVNPFNSPSRTRPRPQSALDARRSSPDSPL